MRVEIALLYEDHTWNTKIVDIPTRSEDTADEAVSRWFSEEASRQSCYRRVVQACVHNLWPDDPKEEVIK